MKTLIVYSTLSGSTMSAAEAAQTVLTTAGHEVTMTTPDAVTKDMVKNTDALIIASPSWEDKGNDGQPLPEITAFINTLTPEDLTVKKIALLGLGDTMYPHFCGAVDVMGEKLKTLGVTPIVEPLRVDRYYSLPDNEQKVKDWAASLAKILL